jgi:hypothetical protein
MICNNALKYPEYSGVDLETLGIAKISAISGSGMTNLNIAENTTTNLPWYNVESDPSNVIGDNSSYRITLDHSSSLSCILNLDINLSGSLGAPQINILVRETGSLTTISETTLVDFNQYFQAKTLEDFAAGNTGQNTTVTVQTSFSTSLLGPGTYYFGLKWTDIYAPPYNNFTFTLDPSGTPKSYLEIKKVRQAADGRIIDIPFNMPYGTNGIKLVDFIAGIQKKFNLVIYPDKTKPNQFINETFNNLYNKGERKDFNKYINLDETIEVIPSNNLAVNELNFGDTLDQDYIAQQFAKGANREFGKTYYTDTTNFYSQGKLEVKTIFASEPLIYLQGTGLSGSVQGLNPTINTFYAGNLVFSAASNPIYVCTSPISSDVYTIDGTLAQGNILYYDQYGTSRVTGFKYFTAGFGGETTEINPVTAEIGYGSGYFC